MNLGATAGAQLSFLLPFPLLLVYGQQVSGMDTRQSLSLSLLQFGADSEVSTYNLRPLGGNTLHHSIECRFPQWASQAQKCSRQQTHPSHPCLLGSSIPVAW